MNDQMFFRNSVSRLFLVLIPFLFLSVSCETERQRGEMRIVQGDTLFTETLYTDGFQTMDGWVNPEINGTKWSVREGGLVGIWGDGGSTVWSKRSFEGDVLIEFKGRLLPPKDAWKTEQRPQGGKNFNFHLFERGPENQDILEVYAPLLKEGTGPNGAGFDQYNGYFLTWTYRHARLRRNPGYVRVQENTSYLPEIDVPYHVQLLFVDGHIRYWINGNLIFDYRDPDPWTKGKIGFTLWESSVRVDTLAVHRVRKGK